MARPRPYGRENYDLPHLSSEVHVTASGVIYVVTAARIQKGPHLW